MFIEAVTPLADALIVVKGGNDDGLFGRLIEGKNVPFAEVPTVRDTEGPLGEFSNSGASCSRGNHGLVLA
jgi:hypothetical protein